MDKSVFVSRVVIRNYKSIAKCNISLKPLTFLVGANGSGKSNFLDALRFITDSLNTTLENALRNRGGIKEVRRRSAGHPTHFTIGVEFKLPGDVTGLYTFKIGSKLEGRYEVQEEECKILKFMSGCDIHYRVESGKVVSTNIINPPAASPDRLYLLNVSGLPEFRILYDFFSHMGFYNLNPNSIKDLQPPDAGDVLARDGSNVSSVLRQIKEHSPAIRERIEAYISKVTSGVSGVDVRSMSHKETIEFRQQIQGAKDPWKFLAANMSDGTLRALGVLVAIFQSSTDPHHRIPLVGIEEPETALHPAAAGTLRDSLREASQTKQIIVTSHSPDLLDDPLILDDSILAVTSAEGVSQIGPLDEAGRSAIREHLYTAGELLRMDQLVPDSAPTFIEPSNLLGKQLSCLLED